MFAGGNVSPFDAYAWRVLQRWMLDPRGGILVLCGIIAMARWTWVAGRTCAFLAGAVATAVGIVCCDVYGLSHVVDAIRGRVGDAPAEAFGRGLHVAVEVLVASAFLFLFVLVVVRGLGFRQPNFRGWPAAFAAGVLTALADRVLNGPFEDWAFYRRTASGFRQLSLSHPLVWGWMLGVPALCVILLLQRSRLSVSPSKTPEQHEEL